MYFKNLLYKFIIYYQVLTFFFFGVFYRLNDINKIVYISIDLFFLLVLIFFFRRTASRRSIVVLLLLFLVFSLNQILANNATIKGLVVMLLVYCKISIFMVILESLQLEDIIKPFIKVGIVNAILSYVEIQTKGLFNPFVNYYTIFQKVESLNKSGLDLYVLRGGFEHPLVTSIMLSLTLPFYLNIKSKIFRYLMMFAQFYLIFGTQKRTGMLLALFFILMLYILNEKYVEDKSVKIGSIISGIVSVIILYIASQKIVIGDSSLYDLFFEKFRALGSSDNFSFVHRVTSIQKSLDIIFNQNILRIILGNGFAFLPMYMSTHNITITMINFLVIDNAYISFLADFGLIGLFFVITYAFGSSIGLMNYIKLSQNIKNKKTGIIVLILFWSVLLAAFSFDILNWYQGILILSLSIAFIETLKRKKHDF